MVMIYWLAQNFISDFETWVFKAVSWNSNTYDGKEADINLQLDYVLSYIIKMNCGFEFVNAKRKWFCRL